MKPSALTLALSLVLAIMFVGTLLMPAATATIVADRCKFEPKRMDSKYPPEIVSVTITFPVDQAETEKRVLEINTSTVLLEGTLSPNPGSNSTTTQPPSYSCDFDGYTVRDIMWLIIAHEDKKPNPEGIYTVQLTITGNLYDGTPFTGKGHIQFKPTHQSSPPPPPP